MCVGKTEIQKSVETIIYLTQLAAVAFFRTVERGQRHGMTMVSIDQLGGRSEKKKGFQSGNSRIRKLPKCL
jgi:hypothetical protein